MRRDKERMSEKVMLLIGVIGAAVAANLHAGNMYWIEKLALLSTALVFIPTMLLVGRQNPVTAKERLKKNRRRK